MADLGQNAVTRIDATTRASGPPIATPAGPRAIAASDAGVWVASATGSVVRIDPTTRRVSGAPVPVLDPAGVAVGDGGVWVTSRSMDRVIRLDPRTGAMVGAPIRVGASPTDVAVGPSGVWVANSSDGTVSHIDPGTGRADPPIQVAITHQPSPGTGTRPHEQPGAAVLALAVGAGGVWVAKTDSPQTERIEVVRIDPATRRVAGRPIAVPGGIPMRMAATDGSVWVTDVGALLSGPGQRAPGLLRIDPRASARSGAAVVLGPEPTGLAVGAGATWVTTAGDNRVSAVVVG